VSNLQTIAIRLLTLGVSTPALAATGEVMSPARIGQTLVVLAAIVACIFALAWLARRVPGLSARSGGTLKLVDALSIGARERILLIEVDGHRLVLAATPGRVERLHVTTTVPAAPLSFAATLAGSSVAQEQSA